MADHGPADDAELGVPRCAFGVHRQEGLDRQVRRGDLGSAGAASHERLDSCQDDPRSVLPMAEITDHEQGQIDRANSSGKTPVVFIHGLWLLPSSWDNWVGL